MKRDLIALAFAMLFPTVMAWVYFVALTPQGTDAATRGHGDSATGIKPEARNPVFQAAYAGSKVVQFSFPLLYLW